MEKHKITKLRMDPIRRKLRVATKENITTGMLRIVFQSDELRGFESPSPDDHIKVFIPGNQSNEQISRDFTPRAWDVKERTLTLDFVLHERGPATEWALNARLGDILEIAGPRGSTIVPDDFDWYLLLGDATAIPSFSRRLQTIRPDVPVYVFLLNRETANQHLLESTLNRHIYWLASNQNRFEDILAFRNALHDFALPPGDGFVWIAAETKVSRELYRYLIEERKHPAEWVKASSYWTDTQKWD